MKAVIIGNSGSGKTWLATRLATRHAASVLHLDNLFWEPEGFDKKREPREVERLIAESKNAESWFVEGVFGELAERYLNEADLLVWLDIPWEICKARLLARGSESKRHLGREQSNDGLKKLVEWASHYYDRTDWRSFTGHRLLLEKFSENAVRLTSEQAVNRFAMNDGCPV